MFAARQLNYLVALARGQTASRRNSCTSPALRWLTGQRIEVSGGMLL